jgi:class 3 adenylate cyclase
MIFCDLSGSTAMGERVDPESVRDMMFSYFHEMRGAIERHGGTVEKFIGDAVMAVFGVPVAHEDDALRAVRASWEMRRRLELLNEELERRFGSRITLRIGVNTGEVVAGDATVRQSLVTGDAVNVAARLEQAASPGEILVGETTYRLVRDAVEVEPVDPLSVKGKSAPLAAFRLTGVEVTAPARARHLDTPMVGREVELARLREKLLEAVSGRAVLATVIGEAGVGKSRLTAELIAEAESTFSVFSGRCLPYGEGITYWPLAEIVRDAARIRDEHSRGEALARLGGLLPGPAASVVAQAIGMSDGEAATDEIAVAFSELFASLGQERPLLVLVDDIHWAEPALLDLLALLGSRGGAGQLILCLARPDLLEEHPAWEVTVRLEPLEEEASTTLVRRLLGEAALPDALARRIAAAAAGNPLFVEELVGKLIDDGMLERRNGGWAAPGTLEQLSIPPTLRELLGARLDRLPPKERSALERGAVEGQVFHVGAVLALSANRDRGDVAESLRALEERDYVRPARADFVDESAFRMRHILIRDAVYEGIPKKTRAALHERFAEWLQSKTGERASEYDEILGYHFERAYRLREELGPVSARDKVLALRAADRLGAAGRRAFARREARAAVNLLLRSADLRPAGDATRLELIEAGGNLLLDAGHLVRARSVLETAVDEARAAGNEPVAARIDIYATWIGFMLDPAFGVAAVLAVTDRAETVLREVEDHHGLARVHDMRAYVFDILHRSSEVEREAELAIAHARAAGSRFHEFEFYWWLFWQLPQGPRSVEDAIRRAQELRRQIENDRAAESAFLESLGELEAMRGRFAEARALVGESMAIRRELGLDMLLWKMQPKLGAVELLADNPQAAESIFRETYEEQARRGDVETSAYAASRLVEALVTQDRFAEAEALLHAAERAEAGDAVAGRVYWRCALASILSRKGEAIAALARAREAVAIVGDTDDLNLQAAADLCVAQMEAASGRLSEAVEAAGNALRRYEQKGNVAAAKKVERLITDLPRRVSC